MVEMTEGKIVKDSKKAVLKAARAVAEDIRGSNSWDVAPSLGAELLKAIDVYDLERAGWKAKRCKYVYPDGHLCQFYPGEEHRHMYEGNYLKADAAGGLSPTPKPQWTAEELWRLYWTAADIEPLKSARPLWSERRGWQAVADFVNGKVKA